MIAGVLILFYYYADQAIRWEAIAIHALLVLSFCFSIFIISLFLIRSVKSSSVFAVLVAGMHIGFSIWFVLIHISSGISFFFWADNVSLLAIFEYLPTIHLLIEHAGYSSALTFFIAGIVLLSIIISWIFWSKKFLGFATSISDKKFSIPSKVLFFLILVISLYTIFSFRTLIKNDRMVSLHGEPFTDFFRESTIFSLRYKPSDIDYQAQIEAANNFRDGLPYNFDEKNVVIIMLDAARADHMSVYGYERETTPFLDSLHSEGFLKKARYATTTCPQSSCGISTMLSSVFFSRTHDVNYKIHEALHDTGYKTHFLLSGDHSRAYSFMRQYYGSKINVFRDGFSSPGEHPGNDRIIINYLDELPSGRNDAPSFFYIHLMSTHLIGYKEEQFNRFEPNNMSRQLELMVSGRNRDLTPEEMTLIRNNYDNNILQADYFIRSIFNKLDQKNLLDNSIVIITSDHGEALGENGYFGHAQDIHHGAISIPFLIYTPEKKSDRTPIDYATLIDIPTTVLGYLDLPIPASWEGVDLLNEQRTYSHHLSTNVNGNQAVIKKIGNEIYMLSYSRNSKKYSVFNLTLAPYEPLSLDELKRDNILPLLLEIYEKEFDSLPHPSESLSE